VTKKMHLLYVKKTKHVMAAVTLAAPPAGQVKVNDIAGTALHVRYILDNTLTPVTPVKSEVWIPAAELDVLAIDFDPLVWAGVLADPHFYQLDSSNLPVFLPPATPSAHKLTVTQSSSGGPVTIAGTELTVSGDAIWLIATSDEQEPKSVVKSQDVTAAVPPAALSISVVLPPSPSGVTLHTVLGLATGYRPTMTDNISF
jgi:hypothetical protein